MIDEPRLALNAPGRAYEDEGIRHECDFSLKCREKKRDRRQQSAGKVVASLWGIAQAG